MGDEEERPLFVGNLDPYVRLSELQELFQKKGKVDKIGMCKKERRNEVWSLSFRVELKTGFAFVFMPNKEEAEDALREYNDYDWDANNRRLMKVEWAKGNGSVKKYVCVVWRCV